VDDTAEFTPEAKNYIIRGRTGDDFTSFSLDTSNRWYQYFLLSTDTGT